ncbi:hypothetical protein GGR42_000003 [Saonia flava]|uniref:DUF2911 domain-containing protein n=1 Tax=Saonia flava TaxID=523696 RepID=A0A846QN69_9FLAO|nr:DUF2911 domain-containing protein [Saonia flava]NJB69541.1 hypothetical protein [Saonia flava]
MKLKRILTFSNIIFFTTVVLLLFSIKTYAQWSYGMEVSPRQSPDKKLFHKIGYTDIEIKYGSPSVKGRKVWGELVPYDKVWRAGANNATVIEFGEDVEINGKALAAGKYGFFILPMDNDRWDIIFNKVYDQWGSFRYDEKEDVLRVQTLPVESKFTEDLTYSVESKGPEYGIIYINWERYKIGFEVKTNHLSHIEMVLTKSYRKADPILKWVCYVEGADYLLKHNAKLDLAIKWINQSEKEVLALKQEWNPKYTSKEFVMGNMYWIKARLLAIKCDFKGALEAADKMKMLKAGFLYYPTFKDNMKIDETIANWENGKN